jgi:hypothetical protein
MKQSFVRPEALDIKFVFISHPMKADIRNNTWSVKRILKRELKGNIVPIAPYLPLFEALDDSVKAERDRGMAITAQYFARQFIDELWVCGKVTEGVEQEIGWARDYDIPVFAYHYDGLKSVIHPYSNRGIEACDECLKRLGEFYGEAKVFDKSS